MKKLKIILGLFAILCISYALLVYNSVGINKQPVYDLVFIFTAIGVGLFVILATMPSKKTINTNADINTVKNAIEDLFVQTKNKSEREKKHFEIQEELTKFMNQYIK